MTDGICGSAECTFRAFKLSSCKGSVTTLSNRSRFHVYYHQHFIQLFFFSLDVYMFCASNICKLGAFVFAFVSVFGFTRDVYVNKAEEHQP